jgi:hypothetical protein
VASTKEEIMRREKSREALMLSSFDPGLNAGRMPRELAIRVLERVIEAAKKKEWPDEVHPALYAFAVKAVVYYDDGSNFEKSFHAGLHGGEEFYSDPLDEMVAEFLVHQLPKS